MQTIDQGAEGVQESLVDSTTLKTIRNLKLRQSFTLSQNAGTQVMTNNNNESSMMNQSIEQDFKQNYKDDQGLSLNSERLKIKSQIVSSLPIKTDNDEKENGKASSDHLIIQEQRGMTQKVKSRFNTFSVPNVDQNNGSTTSLGNIPLDSQKLVPENITINMEQAITFVFSKSKDVKQRLEQQNVSPVFLQENVLNNKHFVISYNSFLMKLVQTKQLNHEFQNVDKKTMTQIEKFVNEKMDRIIYNYQLKEAYLQKSKNLQTNVDQRSFELREQILQPDKLSIDFSKSVWAPK